MSRRGNTFSNKFMNEVRSRALSSILYTFQHRILAGNRHYIYNMYTLAKQDSMSMHMQLLDDLFNLEANHMQFNGIYSLTTV